MDFISIIVQGAGIMGASASLVMFMPQAWRIWQLRHDSAALEGLSLGTLWGLLIAQISWLVYGVGIKAVWTALPAIVVLPLAIFMIFMVSRAKRRHRASLL